MIDKFPRIEAFIIILLLSPFLLLISFMIIVFNGFPILFYQERVGKHYKTFNIIKFRSMIINDQQNKITIKGDKRITRFGSFIRKYKIDELPQLWNIFRNEMDFIGPRPEVLDYVVGNDFSFLEKIKPGLSDFSSIIFRNEEIILEKRKDEKSYLDLLKVKLRLCNLYAQNKSLMLDLVLIFMTVISLIFPIITINILDKYVIKKLDNNLSIELKNWI